MKPSRAASNILLAAALALVCALLWAWGESRTLLLAWNTAVLAAAVCCIAAPLGFLAALLIERTDVAGRRVMQYLLTAMLFMPLYLQTAAWEAGFGRQGWYSFSHGLLAQPLLHGWTGAIWVHAMAAIAWVFLIVRLGVRQIDAEWEEQGLLDASQFQVFRRITLRMAAAPLLVAILWVFVTVAGEMTVADAYQVNTYARELSVGFALGDNPNELRATASPSVLLLAGFTICALAVARRLTPARRQASMRYAPRIALGRAKSVWGIVLLLIGLMMIGVPLANLLYQLGLGATWEDGQRVRFWSLAKALRLLENGPELFGRDFMWTAFIGIATATLSLAVGLPLAWKARRGGFWAVAAIFLISLGWAIPGPVIGLQIISLMNASQWPLVDWLYSRTIAAPVLATSVRAIPLALLICWHAMSSTSDDTLDSAATEGATPWRQFWAMAAVPNLRGFAVAWLAAFAVATGDVTTSVLVVPPGIDTVARRIFGFIHTGVDDQVAALCLTSIAGYTLLAIVAYALLPKDEGRENS